MFNIEAIGWLLVVTRQIKIIDEETNSVLNSFAITEPDVEMSPTTDNVEDIEVAPNELVSLLSK